MPKRERPSVDIKLAALILLLVSLALNGCSSSTTHNISPLQSTFATPTADTNPPSLPTPTSGYAVMGGRLVRQDSGEPVTGRIIYLGNILPLKPSGFLITMAEQNGIRTVSDQDGYFVFTDIVSGTYALILWSPTEPQVLTDPATGEEYLISVHTGQSLYVGELPVTVP